MPQITSVADRPYTLTFHATGTSYPLTSDEVRRLLDEYPVISATRNRIVLPGHNTSDPKQRCSIRPATLGGGFAFVINQDTDRRQNDDTGARGEV